MMWFVWLTNRLFGWHWVLTTFGCDDIVRRVKRSPTGRLYFKCYGDIIWLDDPKKPFEPLTWVDGRSGDIRMVA